MTADAQPRPRSPTTWAGWRWRCGPTALPPAGATRLPVAMCVSEPGLVVAVAGETALVAIRGVVRDVPLTVLSALGIDVAPGDHVLVHTGLAVAVLTAEEAAARTAFLCQGAAHDNA